LAPSSGKNSVTTHYFLAIMHQDMWTKMGMPSYVERWCSILMCLQKWFSKNKQISKNVHFRWWNVFQDMCITNTYTSYTYTHIYTSKMRRAKIISVPALW